MQGQGLRGVALSVAVLVVSALLAPVAASAAPGTTASTVVYVGRVPAVVGLGEMASDPARALVVPGRGILPVSDPTGDLVAGTEFRVTLAVPAGLEVPAAEPARFAALRDHALAVAPLDVVAAERAGRGVAAQVTTTPMSPGDHRVFVVLVSPSKGARATTQSTARATALVAHADAYWGAQSEGRVGFTLGGVVPWYSSSSSCATGAGTAALWAQAEAKVAAQFRVTPGENDHVILLLPPTARCGDVLLSTLGSTVNEGGYAWLVSDAVSKPAFTREKNDFLRALGHQMSLGFASALDCYDRAPDPGYDGSYGCDTDLAGDGIDVMSVGTENVPAGSLSSAHGIRSGIWPRDAWQAAPPGTSTFELTSVSSHDGLRAVTVLDDTGIVYFIEFRNLTAEDAPFRDFPEWVTYGRYGLAVGAPNEPAVRVLRLDSGESSDAPGYQALPGYDSLSLQRREVDYYSVNPIFGYTEGQSWYSRGTSGSRVRVVSITADTATIEVTRGSGEPVAGFVDLAVTVAPAADEYLRVGDTLTAFLGDRWVGEQFEYRWQRDGVDIDGATGSSLKLTPADLGAEIRAGARALSPGFDPTEWAWTEPFLVDGPSASPYAGPGSVAVSAGASALEAVLAEWPDGTTATYQWLRGSVAIPKATAASYIPTAADRGATLSVRVAAAVPGYGPRTVRSSAGGDYTLGVSTGAVSITGVAAVGGVLSVTDDREFAAPALGPVTVSTRSYQWYRGGVAIRGATAASYRATASDLATALTVRVTAAGPGTTPLTVSTPATPKIVRGTLTGTRDVPVVTQQPGSAVVLTAALPAGSITEPGVTVAYQWMRVNRSTGAETPIPRAVSATYRATSADYPFELRVRVTVSKTAYNSVVLRSVPVDYSVRPTAPLAVAHSGLVVGGTVSIGTPEFVAGGATVTPTLAVQWLRNKVPLRGATATERVLAAADRGTTVSFTLRASVPGFLGYAGTSPVTARVAAAPPAPPGG